MQSTSRPRRDGSSLYGGYNEEPRSAVDKGIVVLTTENEQS